MYPSHSFPPKNKTLTGFQKGRSSRYILKVSKTVHRQDKNKPENCQSTHNGLSYASPTGNKYNDFIKKKYIIKYRLGLYFYRQNGIKYNYRLGVYFYRQNEIKASKKKTLIRSPSVFRQKEEIIFRQ